MTGPVGGRGTTGRDSGAYGLDTPECRPLPRAGLPDSNKRLIEPVGLGGSGGDPAALAPVKAGGTPNVGRPTDHRLDGSLIGKEDV